MNKKDNQVEQLTETQTILNTLMCKINEQQHRKMKDFRQYLDSNAISPCKHKSQYNQSVLNEQDSKYQFGKQLFYVQESPQKQPSLKINNLRSKNKQTVLTQSSNILVSQNLRLKQRLQKCESEKLILLSYQSQVQFLKKVNLIQSQQIQKLRRMLRLQKQKQLQLITHNRSKDITQNDQFISSQNNQFFKKACQQKNKKKINSFQGSTQKKRTNKSINILLQKNN